MNVPLVCCWSKVNVWQIRPLTVWSSLKTQEASFDHLTVILRGKTPRGDKERCNRWLYTLSVNYGVLTFQMRGLLPKIMFFKSHYKSDVCQHFFYKLNTHKLYTWFCAQTSRGQSSQDHYPQAQRRIKLSWRSYRLFSIDSHLLHGDLCRIFVSTLERQIIDTFRFGPNWLGRFLLLKAETILTPCGHRRYIFFLIIDLLDAQTWRAEELSSVKGYASYLLARILLNVTYLHYLYQ